MNSRNAFEWPKENEISLDENGLDQRVCEKDMDYILPTDSPNAF